MVRFRRSVPGLSDVALSRFVRRASLAAGLQGAVSVLVTSNSELRALNRRFRRADHATDVLTFPSGFGNGFAGDVAISADMAAKNATRLGHTVRAEIKVLALHGVLHLAGYDHERDHGEMAVKEAHLRKSLGLPSGLIERQGQPPRSVTVKMTQRGPKNRTANRRSSDGDEANKPVIARKHRAGRSARGTPR